MSRFTLFLAAVAVCLCGIASGSDVGYHVEEGATWKVLYTSGKSTLYSASWAGSLQYDNAPLLVDLVGDRYTIGYDYGYLLGKQIVTVYTNFFAAVLGDSFFDLLLRGVVEEAVDWQWDSFLSKQVPQTFMEELKGMRAGGVANGEGWLYNLDQLVTRTILLANTPGDLQDMIYVLLDEYNRTLHHQAKDFQVKVDAINKVSYSLQNGAGPQGVGHQCSMFSVWGQRTQDGSLFSCRNLDWLHGTGISQAKLVAVFRPTDGAYAHATYGFAGMYGALAGMSSKGIVVTEANLEENVITFYGMPWTLRLRWIMENAHDLRTGLDLWAATNNTVGFNHMIGSAVDAPATSAVCMETMEDYTAYFFDNDPREASATYQGKPIGAPLPFAVWRTNNGYDPLIRSHFMWSQSPTSWSVERYMFAHEAFSSYERNQIKIGVQEAINVTSILGDKGQVDPYHCQNNTSGSNILSVTFHPGAQTAYVSWENGMANAWRPATCNIYVKIDMSQFW